MSDRTPLPSQRAPVVRGCAWCTFLAVGQFSNGWWACDPHLTEHERLDQAVRESAERVREVEAEIAAAEDDRRQRLTAYEDALRGIAAATIAARRTPYRLDALQTMLADVEHHLSSLIVLGFVPPNSNRPVTTSAPLDPRDHGRSSRRHRQGMRMLCSMTRHGKSCITRPRYRFTGAHFTRGGRRVLTWEKFIPGDSRLEQVTVDAGWFYGQMLPK